MRATQPHTYDGRVVLVPNAELFTSHIINNTASPVCRSRVSLAIGYDSDLQKVMSVTRKAAQAAEGVLADPPASVRVQELGPDDIMAEVRFWTDSRRSNFVATTSAVRTAIVLALKEAEISLPEPGARVLTLRFPEV